MKHRIIAKNAKIGNNCKIGFNVVIHPDTIIGNNVRIDDNTVIGKLPMKAAISKTTETKSLPGTIIEDNCLVGANCVIYRGAKISKDVLIADLASIREDVSIGEKTIVGRGVAIENKCRIGKRCKIETNVYITALSEIKDNCFIAPGVLTSNDNFAGRSEERYKHYKGATLKTGARIGVGAIILPGKTLNEDCLIAAGSVVTQDIKKNKIAMGIPAKEKKDVPKDQLLENQ